MNQENLQKSDKERVKKNVERGQAHIQSSFNDTINYINRCRRKCFIMGICRWTRIQRI